MSDLTDNYFSTSAERIWLCKRLNNAGKYCDIILKIMVMLQNACENTSAPYVRYLVKKLKETDILVDKPKRIKSITVRTPENIAVVAESVCEAPSIHRRSQQLNISKT